MAFEPPIAVLDACVLYPFHVRNIVVQAAVDGLIEARWTEAIHDEWMRSLATGAAAIPIERLQITRRLMNEALPAATIEGYEVHIARVELPDPDDRHVVAAGVAARASIIITWNQRHFPAEELQPFGLRAETPDAVLADLYDKAPDLIVGSLANARRNLRKSGLSASAFVEVLARQRLSELAMRIRKHRGGL